MRPLTVTLLLLLVFSIPVPLAGANWPKVTEQTVDALVRIQTYNPHSQDMTGMCTAFVIEDGLAWTAAHCVGHPLNKFTTVAPHVDGTPVEIVGIGPYYDVALLRHERFTQTKRTLKMAKKWRLGESVMLVGYETAHTFGPVARQGIVHAIANEWLSTSFVSEPGNSGSPVVNEKGEVVGLAVNTAAREDITTIVTPNALAKVRILYRIGR